MGRLNNFQINLQLPGRTHVESFAVTHTDETFDIDLLGQSVALLNNGDNSWSQLKGDLPQEWVNALGEAIENVVKKMP